ncbi:MAG: N-acetylglucosamine-6-phosphate deacetylase [Suilimivivens sp.]|nr:N-acetylglucosamine-6-phosphate deacetylase [Lachnospiraceae bacterium]
MIIKNASVYTEENRFEEKDVYIAGEVFADENGKGVGKEVIIDADGCYAIPGLTDIHFHGCMGSDFCDGTIEAIDTMAAYEASVGVTTIVPATMTLGSDQLYQICETAAAYKKAQEAGEKEGKAIFCGINMEGPFISKDKMGAQNPAYIHNADQELFNTMQEKSGNLIKLVAIAPETDGAMEFIHANRGKTVLSLAHTTADYDTAMKAFKEGASHVTHLYNAMPPFSHRAPGVVGAAADAGAEAELICDGVHIHPGTVRATFKMLGDDKIILISDSMMATGLEDGNYSLGGQDVKVTGTLATLKDGTIAGSATNLMDCVRRAVKDMQIPLESAVKCAAVNSAKSVGIYDKYGSISTGKVANLVLLRKEDLSLYKVILKGQVLNK